jgi:surfactin synthase thioesterase subunit
MGKINLFCLPFGGGSKYSYRALELIPSDLLKLVTLEYPGRGRRIKEALLTDIHQLTDDLFDQISKFNLNEPYAIYGHSMGGLLTYLLTKKLAKAKCCLPKCLFVSGCTGPSSTARLKSQRHLLSNEKFLQEIKDLKGCPDEILENPELVRLILEILRADFKASETYIHKPSLQLAIPITVMTGIEEDMEVEDVRLWQHESSFIVDFHVFPGHHFFILDHAPEIINIFSKSLTIVNHKKI